MVLISAVILLTASAMRNAAVNVLAFAHPNLALRLDATNAAALVARSDRKGAASGGLGIDTLNLETDGARALLSAPLSASALRMLGLAADVRRDSVRASRLMTLSQRVSRHDVGTSVWLINDAVRRGDIPHALEEYDLALTINNNTSTVLFPPLTASLENAGIAHQLAGYVAEDRIWVPSFLSYAASYSAHPEDVANLVMSVEGASRRANLAGLSQQLLMQLVLHGNYDAARHYLLHLPGYRPQILNDLNFSQATIDSSFAPLTWTLSDQPEVTALTNDIGQLQVSVAPGGRGIVAQRVLMLAKGRYLFSQTIALSPQPEPLRARWSLQCGAQDAAQIFWQYDLPLRVGQETYQTWINIPEGCGVQKISLSATGGEGAANADMTLGQLSVSQR